MPKQQKRKGYGGLTPTNLTICYHGRPDGGNTEFTTIFTALSSGAPIFGLTSPPGLSNVLPCPGYSVMDTLACLQGWDTNLMNTGSLKIFTYSSFVSGIDNVNI